LNASESIRVSPEVEWPAGQVTNVIVTVDLPSGHVLTNWASFLLTLREDPKYPRVGDVDCQNADPTAEGWASTLTASGSVASSTTLSFSLTTPAGAGWRRYAMDVWGIGGAAGNVCLFPTTWVSISPRTR
jgi:hypothetical protein